MRDALVMTVQGPVRFLAATARLMGQDAVTGKDMYLMFEDPQGAECARFVLANVIGYAWPDLAMPPADLKPGTPGSK